MNDLNMPDSAMPDFSLPDLSMADLSVPGFRMPDVNNPDPRLPDLTVPQIPEELDRLPVSTVDPPLPDLTMPLIPGELEMQDVHAHAGPGIISVPEVEMEERPGDLNGSALSLVQNSPDMRQLPQDLTYATLYTNADDMTRRHRHLGMLELGLEGQVEVRNER